MKLDLQKACDSLEWSFLKEMLQALSFPSTFIKLIMECVTTSQYSLSLNGEVFGFFKGQRGLRQGAPLSPLLFTVGMEYLTRVLNVVQEYEEFKYHPLCRNIKLTHLYFANDLLMFCRGDRSSMILLLRAFATFSAASGLKMNASKSNIYGNGLIQGLLQKIAGLSGLKVGSLPFKYLGIPIAPRKLSVLECNILVEKVLDRIRALGARKLSYAGERLVNPDVDSWKVDETIVDLSAKGISFGKGIFMHIPRLWSLGTVSVNPKSKVDWGLQDEDGCYTIAKGYKWLRGEQPEVSWHSWIWNRINLPKHRCIQLISAWCEVQLPTADLEDWWSKQIFRSQEERDISLQLNLFIRKEVPRPMGEVTNLNQCIADLEGKLTAAAEEKITTHSQLAQTQALLGAGVPAEEVVQVEEDVPDSVAAAVPDEVPVPDQAD
ncbi:uncharacterized protein LOC141595281 [Silene latifolia]|uniref:uncharacterized protein LOC141595281 n=1 Tax=Silene latifolia TaxID=37657 RepID=UPI003D76FA01